MPTSTGCSVAAPRHDLRHASDFRPVAGNAGRVKLSRSDLPGMPPMSIRSTVPAVAALLLALAVADVSAGQRHGFGNDERGCSVESDYTIRVDGKGFRLDADDDAQVPRRVEVRDGSLRVDGKPQSVSAADARRLREMESGTRALLPEIAGITREDRKSVV